MIPSRLAQAGAKAPPPTSAYGAERHVLLVEDNAGDVRLTREALREARTPVHLHVAGDGVEAIAFLKREGVYADAPRPELILLDLHLPKVNGHEVLSYIKMDDGLKTIPTVVLTSSSADADVARSYQLQANCVTSKPQQLDAFTTLVRSINEFWLATVTLPQTGPGH